MKSNSKELSEQELAAEVKKISEEDPAQYPSLFEMGRNMFRTAWMSAENLAKGQPILASPERAMARLNICQDCVFFVKDQSRCQKCGCYMKTKVNIEASACPANLWGDLQSVAPGLPRPSLPAGATEPKFPKMNSSIPKIDDPEKAQTMLDAFLGGNPIFKYFTDTEKEIFKERYKRAIVPDSQVTSFTVKNITFSVDAVNLPPPPS